jgi:hypothetical protein
MDQRIIDGAVRVRKEKRYRLHCLSDIRQMLPALLSLAGRAPRKNHVEFAPLSLGRFMMVTSRTPSSSFNFAG